jgi:ferredoxin-NADP reductase
VTDLHLVRVTRRNQLATDVVGLTLEAVDGALPSWTPGAHVDVLLPSGTVRQYSLCGPLTGRAYEIAVLHEPTGRGGSREVHHALQPGTELKISAPRNRFALERAASYLFVAGGIGITPVLPMIEAVDGLGLPWRLVYGGRTRGSMAFLDLLDLYDEDRIELVPQDELGLIDVSGLAAAHRDAAVYTCGPGPLIDALAAVVPGLHFERFVSVPGSLPVETGPASAFEVQLGADGPVVPVAEDQSVLSAVLDAGSDVLFSCEEGTCGSCQTTVLAGEVEHRDGLLTDAEREAGEMLICVSRCRGGRLVLDVPAP